MNRKPKINLSLTLLTASALLAASAVMTACDQKELTMPDSPLPQRDRVPLQLTSGISTTRGITRAHDTWWDANDKIGVFTTKAGGDGTTEHPYELTASGSQSDANIAYTIATAQQTLDGTTHVYKAFSPFDNGSQIYLPADGSDVDVYAYYPWTNGVGITASDQLNISITGTTAAQTFAEQKSFDVLKAKVKTDLAKNKPIDIDHTTAQLLFSHILSKVIIKVKVGTGYSSTDLSGRVAATITGQPVSAKFNPVTQALTITDGSNTIIPHEITDSNDPEYSILSEANVVCAFRALLLPNLPNGTSQNPATDTDRKIIFTVGDKTPGAVTATYQFDLSNNNTPAVNETPAGSPNVFEEGKVTVFTLTLAATGITIEASIEPWSTVNISPDDPLYEVTGS